MNLLCVEGLPGYAYGAGSTSATPTNYTTQHGYICPKGTYCPARSSSPHLCPIGTYQPLIGQGNSTACNVCESGTYQYEAGQSSCYRCSSSSTSVRGSPLCTCLGKNRAFQPGDGFCICSPGFEFVNNYLTISSENDGAYDCQPIVYKRCFGKQERNLDGECVDPTEFCGLVCGPIGGEFSDTTGELKMLLHPSCIPFCTLLLFSLFPSGGSYYIL